MEVEEGEMQEYSIERVTGERLGLRHLQEGRRALVPGLPRSALPRAQEAQTDLAAIVEVGVEADLEGGSQ